MLVSIQGSSNHASPCNESLLYYTVILLVMVLAIRVIHLILILVIRVINLVMVLGIRVMHYDRDEIILKFF